MSGFKGQIVKPMPVKPEKPPTPDEQLDLLVQGFLQMRDAVLQLQREVDELKTLRDAAESERRIILPGGN